MPSPTNRSARFMALCSSLKGRKKAREKCPPMDVAREFHAADKAMGERTALAKALKGKRS